MFWTQELRKSSFVFSHDNNLPHFVEDLPSYYCVLCFRVNIAPFQLGSNTGTSMMF